MNMLLNRKTVFAMALCPLVLAGGCATQQGNDQLMGAGAGMLGGAALGCLTGFIASGSAGGCATGAAIGAATGAVVGWGAVKLSQYQATQLRPPQEEQKMYGLAKSVDAPQVKIQKRSSSPKEAKPGEAVNVATEYSVQLPSNVSSTSVTEDLILKKDGKVLTEIPQQHDRTAGGWGVTGSFPIPKNAPPGTYVIEHKVKAGNSYDSDESTFLVSK